MYFIYAIQCVKLRTPHIELHVWPLLYRMNKAEAPGHITQKWPNSFKSCVFFCGEVGVEHEMEAVTGGSDFFGLTGRNL